MSLIALLEYIPRTGSLASQQRLCATWLSVRLLARALCLVGPLARWGEGMARLTA